MPFEASPTLWKPCITPGMSRGENSNHFANIWCNGISDHCCDFALEEN